MLLGIGGVQAAARLVPAHRHARSPRSSTPTRATPASRASSGSASSPRPTGWPSPRRCRRCAPARCSPRTPRCRPASTGSRGRSSSATSPASACRWSELLALGAEEDADQVQHGPHGPAAGPARQRRERAARPRQPGHVLPTCGPGFDEDDVPIGSITNGVHAPTWTARELVEMGTQTHQPGRPGRGRRPGALRRRRPHHGRRPVEHPADAARPAGRRGAPPDPRDRAVPRRDRGRGRLDRRPPSTPTSSPSASPAGCRPTSG